MKRAAEPNDDAEQPPRQQQRTEAAFVRIGTEKVPLDTAELDLHNKNYYRLARQGLEALPESIGELKALTKLHVSGHQLTKLPAAIGSLTALTKLNVSRNQLKELPAAIGSLTALTWLHDADGREADAQRGRRDGGQSAHRPGEWCR